MRSALRVLAILITLLFPLALWLGEGRVAIFVGPWVNVPDYNNAMSEVNQAILEAFRRGGIPAPVPQREVRMLAARS